MRLQTYQWHYRCDDVRRGSDPINIWDGFKRKLKKYFYPEDAECKARTKLHRLQHKDNQIRDSVNKLQELFLEILSIREHDSLICFLNGLQ